MTEFHTRDETLKYEKQHHAMDKSTQFCILDSIRLHCVKNWTHTPSASGSYGRQTGQPRLADKSLVVLKIFKSYNSTSSVFQIFK